MDLTPEALAQEWAKGKFRPAYLLVGEDDAAKLQALERLKATLKPDPFNLAELRADSDAAAAEVVSACNTPPMFADRRLVVVKGSKLGAAGRKELAAYLRDPLPSTTLVLVSEELKADMKDPVAAAVAALGGVAAFKALKEGEAVARLREEARRAGVNLAQDAAERMVEEAGTEWGILRAELEKLRLFVKGRPAAGLEDVLACLGYRRETNPFDFPRALQARDAARSLELLRRMLEEESDPFQLLARIKDTVNKQLRAKRLLKGGAGQDQVFRELRLNSWYDKDYLALAARLPEARLARELRACLETEVALKSRAWLDPGLELEMLVASICAARPAASRRA